MRGHLVKPVITRALSDLIWKRFAKLPVADSRPKHRVGKLSETGAARWDFNCHDIEILLLGRHRGWHRIRAPASNRINCNPMSRICPCGVYPCAPFVLPSIRLNFELCIYIYIFLQMEEKSNRSSLQVQMINLHKIKKRKECNFFSWKKSGASQSFTTQFRNDLKIITRKMIPLTQTYMTRLFPNKTRSPSWEPLVDVCGPL